MSLTTDSNHLLLNPLQITHKLNGKTNGNFNIIYINVNALRYKLHDIEHILSEHANITIHIVALTETRLFEDENKYFNIPNYTAHFSNRNDGYGGPALFIHETINYAIKSNENCNNINYIDAQIIDHKISMWLSSTSKQEY